MRLAVPEAADLCALAAGWVSAGRLDAALDLSVVEFDHLAQLAGVTVTEVLLSGDEVALHYRVAWTAFHACDDRHIGGQHARVLRGRREGAAWVFPPQAPWPTARDTADEF